MVKLMIAIVLTVVLYALVVAIALAENDKVTFCHATGREGTTHFVTLTTSYNAAFGQAGHFNENGTPRAGHEQDYLGACIVVTTTSTPTPTATTIETPTPTVTIETPTVTPTPIGTSIINVPARLPNTGGQR